MAGRNMSNYAKRMAHLSARIFGEVARPTTEKSMKVIKMFSERPEYMRTEVINYYPKHQQLTPLMRHVRYLGLFRDEHQDFNDEIKRLKALRGKVKPKKGEGKRAIKRK